jgi:GNAT superfamily N-acetyltransferase
VPTRPQTFDERLRAVGSFNANATRLEEQEHRALVRRWPAGWLVRNADTLTAHWARVLRVQTALGYRGAGVGRALMREVERAARDDLRLNHLHLELRGGMGLERFYESCGWPEIGRWPEALCLDGNELRDDEVLMHLPLR